MKHTLLAIICILALMGCKKSSTDSGDMQNPGGDMPLSDGTLSDQIAGSKCSSDAECTPGKCNLSSGQCMTPCVGPGDCGAGEECNTQTGVCETATPCQQDADCGGTGFCSCRNTCLTGKKCQSSQNCGVNEYCDTHPNTDQPVSGCLGTCRARKKLCDPCSISLACGQEKDSCLNFTSGGKYCGISCTSDSDCLAIKPGFVCSDLGNGAKQCVPISGDCQAPGKCNKTRDCNFGEYCGQNLTCVAGCVDNSACPVNKVCSAFKCQDACDDSSNPCEEGFVCENQKCVVPDGCKSSKECHEKETYCDTGINKCVPGCQVDDDCKAASKKCDGGKCVDKGCAGNYQCGFGQVCNKTTLKCEEAVGPYCDSCDPEQEGCGGSDKNKCVSFQDEDGNDLGAFCLVACGSDPENPCPSGYQCTELKDQDGNVQANVCSRGCYQKPVGLGE